MLIIKARINLIFSRYTFAIVTVPKSRVLPQMAIFVPFTPKRRLVNLHICAGVVTGQCNKYQNLMCWQRRPWRVCTFALARLSLATVTKYNVLVPMAICVLFVNSKCCGESAPWHICATISALNLCVKICSQCVVIKILNKTFASLLRKNK